MARRFGPNHCPVSSSVNSHLDWEDRQAEREEAEEREYWADGNWRTLVESPEGEGWEPIEGSMDCRDKTKEPPAYLDPLWVLLMRERLKRYQETGEVWFRPSGGASHTREENANA